MKVDHLRANMMTGDVASSGEREVVTRDTGEANLSLDESVPFLCVVDTSNSKGVQ